MMNMNTIKMVMFERLGLWSVQKPHGAQNKIVLAGAQSLTMKSMPLMTSLVALHPKTCLMGHLNKPQSYQEKNPGRGAQKWVSINQVQLKANSIKWSKMIMLYWLCRQQCKNSGKKICLYITTSLLNVSNQLTSHNMDTCTRVHNVIGQKIFGQPPCLSSRGSVSVWYSDQFWIPYQFKVNKLKHNSHKMRVWTRTGLY